MGFGFNEYVWFSGNALIKQVTTEYKLSQDDLFPGAYYQLQVFAISHGLYSESHENLQAVCKFTVYK